MGEDEGGWPEPQPLPTDWRLPGSLPQAPPVSRQAPSSPYVKLSGTEVFCFIFIWEGQVRPLELNKIAEICKVYS